MTSPSIHTFSVDSILAFHRTAGFWGFYLIVFYCVTMIMLQLETLLMPFLWAFFICVALLPFIDLVEDLIVFSYAFFFAYLRHRNCAAARDDAWDDADQPRDHMGKRFDLRYGRVRFWAVIFVLASNLAVMCGFAYFLYENVSALHEKTNIYRKGFARFGVALANSLEEVSLPFIESETIANMREGNIINLEELQDNAVAFLLDKGGGIALELLMMLLYLLFWLFYPMPLDPSVRTVFQKYILIKSIVSMAYACSVLVLLTYFDVDMSVAIALLTFMLNFVPEIGAILCIALPLPIIVFDGRLENPIPKAVLVLICELMLKLIYGNIIEVLVLESDLQMKMHPVVILLCISFFGWVWGPTGMLLSVPITAAFKILVITSAIPSQYKDPIVRALEGDQEAMERWRHHSRMSEPSGGMSMSPFAAARRSTLENSSKKRSTASAPPRVTRIESPSPPKFKPGMDEIEIPTLPASEQTSTIPSKRVVDIP